MNKITALVIDDEQNLTRMLALTLQKSGIDCIEAHEGKEGIVLAEKHLPDIILLDVRLPDISGLDTLAILQQKLPEIPVIIISAHGDTKDAVFAIKNGAVDYLTKPFDIDELLMLIKNTISKRQIQEEVLYLRKKNTLTNTIIGESQAVNELKNSIHQVASSHFKTILLLGDTGVGKSMIARAIHQLSLGDDAPFVDINCASFSEQLMEAELFGAEKGAYTGADKRRTGLVEIAQNGTLFLDEIGELPIALQAKLLTFLESWRYRPLGSPREKQANIHLIAATNQDISEHINSGKFRSDLFFRLNTLPIKIPPLHQREKDAWILANFFAENIATQAGNKPIELSPTLEGIFTRYHWPGNIRELKNHIERLTILYPGKEISESMLPPEMLSQAPQQPNLIKDSLLDAERKIIQEALWDTGGRKGLAAEKLGISRHALKRKLQKLGLT